MKTIDQSFVCRFFGVHNGKEYRAVAGVKGGHYDLSTLAMKQTTLKDNGRKI